MILQSSHYYAISTQEGQPPHTHESFDRSRNPGGLRMLQAWRQWLPEFSRQRSVCRSKRKLVGYLHNSGQTIDGRGREHAAYRDTRRVRFACRRRTYLSSSISQHGQEVLPTHAVKRRQTTSGARATARPQPSIGRLLAYLLLLSTYMPQHPSMTRHDDVKVQWSTEAVAQAWPQRCLAYNLK